MKRALLTALVLAALPAAAFAQTCASPISMHAPDAASPAGGQVPGRVYSGDTTTGTQIGINLAGVILAHPSIVYSFTANNESGNVVLTGTDRVVVIAESCTASPLAIGDSNNPMAVPSLTDGQNYLLIVSTSPGLPVTNPPTGGPYTVTIPVLPVSLQSFSVE